MIRRSKRNDAALRAAQNKLKMEECVSSMGQWSPANYAAPKDAQIKFKTVECARSMGRRGSNAALKNAQI